MRLEELRPALALAGVQLSCTPEGRLKYEAAGPLPPALIEGMKEHRAALLLELQPGGIPPLPWDLARMVQAAASGQLHGGAALPSGRVIDLAGYVLAWAAAYLTGDEARALARLEEARRGWTS